jgi:pimeloyl-ACP methyl ester carboxylesterase
VNNLPGIASTGVTFIGHSLGSLNGGAFVGASTASGNPDLFVSGTHLLTPVAGLTRLLENSPSFAPTILGGLRAAAGLSQGDANLETFLNVNQASFDSVDPINFASELAVSNTILAQVAGDRTTPNAADTRFGEDKGPLEITFPNGLTVRSPAAPLSGSEALAAIMAAAPTASPLATPMITRYQEGVHATPVLPQAEIAEAGDVLKSRSIASGGEVIVSAENAQATFGTMIEQTLELIGGRAEQP